MIRPAVCTYIPQPPLANFVEKFWWDEGNALPHTKERILPHGSMDLIINLHKDTFRVYDQQHHDHIQSFRGCLLTGARSEFSLIDTANLVSTVSVHFKPGGAFPFLPLPAGELHNRNVSLDELWGQEASDLREQLLEAGTPDSMFRILEQFLLSHIARPLALHPAVAYSLKEFQRVPPYPNTQTISEVSERIGLSHKRFVQVFREAVGLTPKLFCRVLRFQEVLHLIEQGQQIEWAQIAQTCGYFDQAHFLHDFRDFSGITPTTYLTQRSEHRNHVPLPD